ncbi:hypothetical protein [Staphylococcus hominis]|uniref:hypothetical protein n=1 Tax=Staphylococcus hominis TaxID=1290 RepID=UPI00287B338C|nr:hypothetical protein [Staphylococcus hominis]MDS3884658.1 hypothetical protein [Staphylococcus hominis]MDS3884804.1 hypothetical protein [Staphylococcus hominis]
MNAIPKIYDEEKNEWVELVTKPIAEEVVRIMEDNFMKNKGQIKLLELPYGYNKEKDSYKHTYYIFYNSKASQFAVDNYKSSLIEVVNEVYESLEENEVLTYERLMKDEFFKRTSKRIATLNLYYEDEFGISQIISSKDTLELGLEWMIGSNNFTVSYIFNDNPLERNQFVHKAY